MLSLQSQFGTFFGPTDQDFMGKCRGNGYMHLVLFWLIGGWFSKEKYTFYEKTEIRLENTRNTKIGVHHRERRVQRFPWV